MNVGGNIKKFRKDRGLTQKKLAEKVGVKENTVRRYENGVIEPNGDRIEKIAQALEIPTVALLIDDWEPPLFIGDTIKKEREKKGLSQVELAKKINRSTEMINKWECGVDFPNTDDLVHISNVLDVGIGIFTAKNYRLEIPFWAHLKRMRIEAGFSLSELSEKAKIEESKLESIEAGGGFPSNEDLLSLANVFKTDIKELTAKRYTTYGRNQNPELILKKYADPKYRNAYEKRLKEMEAIFSTLDEENQKKAIVYANDLALSEKFKTNK